MSSQALSRPGHWSLTAAWPIPTSTQNASEERETKRDKSEIILNNSI